MPTNCRSSSPEITHGARAVESVRCAVGVGRVPSHAFTAAEAMHAAEIIWPETGLPRPLAVVGIVYDMMPGHLSPRRGWFAKQIGVHVETVRAAELIYEMLDGAKRIEYLAAATRIARVRRIGGQIVD